MNKNRKYKKSYREMAEEAGVSVGTIAKAVKVEELGRSQEVIGGIKTADEILKEAGLSKKKTQPLDSCISTLPKLTDAELEVLCSAIVDELERRHR